MKDVLPRHNLRDINERGPCTDPRTYVEPSWSGDALDVLNMDNVPVRHRLWCVLHADWLPAAQRLEIGLFALNCAEKRAALLIGELAKDQHGALVSYISMQHNIRRRGLSVPYFEREDYMNESRTNGDGSFWLLRWALSYLIDFDRPMHAWNCVVNAALVGRNEKFIEEDAYNQVLLHLQLELWDLVNPGARQK